MCLVNDAVYIAKYDNGKWTATGTQFQVPYVFKTLFSKEPIEFKDLCETKSVSTALYLDMNEGLTVQTAAEKELADRIKAGMTEANDKYAFVNGEFEGVTNEDLEDIITKGHKYVFIGRVGQFCPIKPGCGGGVLLRENTDKKTGRTTYAAAGGTKGYRWLESEMVQELHKEDDIDRRYYNKLVDDAVSAISQYGDFEGFIA